MSQIENGLLNGVDVEKLVRDMKFVGLRMRALRRYESFTLVGGQLISMSKWLHAEVLVPYYKRLADNKKSA